MKMYVAGYRPRDWLAAMKNPKLYWEDVLVTYRYERSESWLINEPWWAELQLSLLRNMKVLPGNHVCRFELEEENGVFAIVCLDHPSPGE